MGPQEWALQAWQVEEALRVPQVQLVQRQVVQVPGNSNSNGHGNGGGGGGLAGWIDLHCFMVGFDTLTKLLEIVECITPCIKNTNNHFIIIYESR